MFAPGTIAKTKHGFRVSILAVLAEPDISGNAIVGLLHDSEGAEVTTWRADGQFIASRPSGLDLVEAAP
jgi:hypothetical protein